MVVMCGRQSRLCHSEDGGRIEVSTCSRFRCSPNLQRKHCLEMSPQNVTQIVMIKVFIRASTFFFLF